MNHRGYLLCFLLAAVAAHAFGQRADFSGLKFCIDPGHGGHNPANDRWVVPDPGVDFWESESNFQKALRLDTLLRARGAWVILTRTTNDYPNDDEPSLTARWQLANANNVNWFHSIHSNATGGTNTSVNSTLVLVKENIATRQPQFPQAVSMSGLIYNHIRQELRTQPTSGNIAPGVYTDYTFYGGTNGGFNLGVLSGLIMPGELSEGSFHDFYPETRRLMNNSYRKMEAYAIMNALKEYFGVTPDAAGRVAGLESEQGTGRILNGTQVRLLPEDRVSTGDELNNGFFLFDNLAPGTHTIRYETPGFLPDSVQVSVVQGAPVFADRALLPRLYPTVSLARPASGDSAFPASLPLQFTFSKSMDAASVQGAFSILPSVNGSPAWSNGNTLLTFTPDSLLPFFQSYTVAIGAGAHSQDGQPLDGNGDGSAGDSYSSTFTTAYVDVIPHIVAHAPASGDTAVAIYRNVSILFDRPMSGSPTGGAFSILPATAGSLAWSSDSTSLTFTPAGTLAEHQSYSVTLARSAKSALGWPLGVALQFTFTTSPKDTAGPKPVRQYPPDGSTGIPSTASVQTKFDEPLVFSTLAGRVRLVDAADSLTQLGLGSVAYTEPGFRGLLSFSPTAPLNPGHQYLLMYLPGITDPLGNPTSSATRIAFTVNTLPVPQGTVVDSFETAGPLWVGPSGDPATTGVDSAITSYDLSATRKRNGQSAGRLIYSFADTAGGVCGMHRAQALGLNQGRGWLGMWVFGDNSGNALAWEFAGSPEAVMGPIDWFGWRFLSVPLTAPVSAFLGIRILQASSGERAGTLYVDDIQTEFATGVGGNNNGPGTFQLSQNFPNPFNPSTTITYRVPAAGRITLKVYDLLGRLVDTIMDGVQPPGEYTVVWHGAGAASGVYFLRLQAGALTGVRKMTLLR